MNSLRIGVSGAAMAVMSVVVSLAQAPPAPNSTPAPPALWSVTADLAAPESAFYDAASGAVFVSNINGGVTDKDGNGYISRLTADGRVVNAKWVTGLNGPKGLRSAGGTLWAADIDEVVGIEIASGRIMSHVKIEGATFLNDLATATDGTIYVSDSQKARIYEVKAGKVSIFVEGEDAIETPNGVLVDGNRVIVGSLGRGVFGPPGGRGTGAPAGGRLFAFDRMTKARTVMTADPIGGIDGIELDGRGGYLVTDVFGSRLLQVGAAGTPRTLLQFPAAGADFGYIAARRIAIVPFLNGNSVSAYDITAALAPR
jgi:sugar lactone lactonase YvrE